MPSGSRRRPPAGNAAPSADAPRIVIAGAAGRLGRTLVHRALARGFTIVGAVDRVAGPAGSTSPRIERASPEVLGGLLSRADVFLSATTPAAERSNLPLVARARVGAVVATTGLGTPPPAWLQRCARRVPIVLDANFSLGIGILRAAVRAIGPLPEGFDLSIVEAHRIGKADHPSGTAQALARDLERSGAVGWGPAVGRRSKGRVEIASLRGGETPGVHVVQVAGPSELLRFEHIAYGREAFAEGMLLAARWLARAPRGRRPGFYTLQDVLAGAGP